MMNTGTAVILILIMAWFIPANAVSLRDGELFLDVRVAEGGRLDFQCDHKLILREEDSPMHFEVCGAFSLTLTENSQRLTAPPRKVILTLEGDVFHLIESEGNTDPIDAEIDRILDQVGLEPVSVNIEGGGLSGRKTLILPLHIETDHTLSVDGGEYTGVFSVRTGRKGLAAVQIIDFESYIAGVIPWEIGDNAPLEALKAQAVSARSTTIHKLLQNKHASDPYDLCDEVHCQVFGGLARQNDKTRMAVRQTRAEMLFFGDKPIDALYCSCCGGRSELPEHVWGNKIPYLKSVPQNTPDLRIDANAESWIRRNNDAECAPGPESSSWEKSAWAWKRTVTRTQLEKNSGITGIERVDILKRGVSGRVVELRIVGRSDVRHLTRERDIRAVFGNLPSSLFFFESHNPWVISGKGSGHGVGLCQVGAIQQARKGRDYREILRYYFPDTEIAKHRLEP